jgi:hypothetical protein
MTDRRDWLAERAADLRRPVHEAVRLHVLEGVLRRVGRLAHPADFVLRGGMLTRLWVREEHRPVNDLDFVGAFPFDADETAQRFARVMHDGGPDDGVCFEPAAFRARRIWQDCDFPGVRLTLRAGLDEPDEEIQVDVGFGDPLVPAARREAYPTLLGEPVPVWCCRPETMVGWKLHGLAEMAEGRWRPKDLYDLWLLTRHAPLDMAALVPALRAAFTSRGYDTEEARAVLGAAWWRSKKSLRRWDEFCAGAAGLDVPDDLADVVARVAERLRPATEHL